MQNDCFPDAPAEWTKGPVSDLAIVNPRYRLEKGREYPFVEMAAVGEQFAGIQRFDTRALEGSGLSRFKAKDTLFAKITPCPQNGKIAFVHSLPGDTGLGSTEFIVLSPKRGTDPRYLYHLLCTQAVRGRAAARMEGSTGRQRVPDEVFTRRLLVPRPAPEEQRAVSALLDVLEASVTELQQVTKATKELRRALMQRLFTEGVRGEPTRKTAIGPIPRTWRVASVGDVVREFQYGLSESMQSAGSLPILRMGDLQDGEVLLDNLKYVTLPDRQVHHYLLNRGDVLFNRTNSQEWVGKVGIYRHDRPAVFASYLIRLIPDASQVDPYYLGHVLQSYSAQCRVKRYATPGVQQVNVNASNLAKVLIPLPDGPDGLDEQRDIAAALEAIATKLRMYDPVLKARQALRESLMNALCGGTLRLGCEPRMVSA